MSGDVLEELDEQGAEITRLRNDNAKLRGIIRLQDAAIRSDTATLTDAEREAVEAAVGRSNRIGTEYAIIDAAILRGLLARCALSTREGD